MLAAALGRAFTSRLGHVHLTRPDRRPLPLAPFQVHNHTWQRLQVAAAMELEKPKTDDRAYKSLVLENGIRAVLVHDPDEESVLAACCVNVNIGYMADPPVRPLFSPHAPLAHGLC